MSTTKTIEAIKARVWLYSWPLITLLWPLSVLAAPSVGLGLLVTFLSNLDLPSSILNVLEILEYALLLVNSILFVVYLVLTALKVKAFHELGIKENSNGYNEDN